MDNTNDSKVQAYDYLRSEIMKHIDLHNTLLTFTITTTVAILTFALTDKNPILFLLPFCILIPMSMRISYYRSAMVKISAYMIVFLESELKELKWETRNGKLMKDGTDIPGFFGAKYTSLRYYECFVLSLVCYICYVFHLNISFSELTNTLTCIKVLSPLVLVIWEFKIIQRTNMIDKERYAWIKQWSEIKQNSTP